MEAPLQDLREQAFQLAHFILPYRDLAVVISSEALSALKTHLKPQRKRLYYSLRGRSVSGFLVKARTKITLEESQKLQSLIYAYSERIERQHEEAFLSTRSSGHPARPIGEEDWVVRFVKHLVAIIVNRSSFYVTLGVSRVLFNYTTEEASRIYDAVTQDRNCRKDAPYFRKQKADVLMNNLKERFGNLLQTRLVAHGEERFKARPDSSQFFPLIKECLERFTPWNTVCVLPERLDVINEPIHALCFNDSNPDKEHPVEARRMHTLIHPDCFGRLVNALGFSSSAQRLEVPMFFFDQLGRGNNSNGNASSDRGPFTEGDQRNACPLSDAELADIERFIQSQTKRRKRARPKTVSVMVDGVERAMAKLNDRLPIRLRVDESDRLIEIKGHDSEGEVKLGTLLLTHRELLSAMPSMDYPLRLGRFKLVLTLSPLRGDNDEFGGADIELSFCKVQTFGGLQTIADDFSRHVQRLRQPTIVFTSLGLLLAAIAAGVMLFRRPSMHQEYVAQVRTQPTPQSSALSPSTKSARDQPTDRQPAGQSPPGRRADQGSSLTHSKQSNKPSEGTRTLLSETARELLAVRKIYVESHPGSPDNALRDAFIKTIVASELQTANEASADAFLVWEIKSSQASIRLEMRLLSQDNKVLWGLSRPIRKNQDETTVASEMAQDLTTRIKGRSP